ncbi:hypothetical protein [Solidesulfovibrio alcoholivorans]|uniref:hypothetical protein n=1 Tax=Solidesulfovibrio alcoholivorans TaxID=81406 RepID=UPI0012EC12D6|nr:hypothetical protein [Solidesulfovibrio alcoholivorans]
METRNWSAWIDVMPMSNRTLYVTGEMMLKLIGVRPVLSKRVPQGINDTIRILDLALKPLGPSAENDAPSDRWVPCRYEEDLESAETTCKVVSIYYEDKLIADIEVKTAH